MKETKKSPTIKKKEKKKLPESIFDEEKNPSNLWERATGKESSSLSSSSPFLAKSIFVKKGKMLGLWTERFVFLHLDFLYYKKNETTSKIKKVMYFDHVSMEKLVLDSGKEKKWGFRFFKNGQSSEIFTSNLLLFTSWRRMLAPRLIQNTFHEDFEILKMIGKGYFSRVFLGRKKETNQVFAIKAIRKEDILSQITGREAITNEVEIMGKMNHRNVLHLFEVFESQNSIYMVLDLLRGGELLQTLQKERSLLCEIDRALILKNLLLGLLHIHEKGVMHRDLKPENIMIREANSITDVVIVDFGLSSRTNLDAKNMLFKKCGTPGFVAPEVFECKDNSSNYTEKCDVFSAGVIFYILITGKYLFLGENKKDIIKKNKECQIDFSLCSSLSDEGKDLLRHMLEKKPEDRISTKDALNHPYFNIIFSQRHQNSPGLKSMNNEKRTEESKNQTFLLKMTTFDDSSKNSLGSIELIDEKKEIVSKVKNGECYTSPGCTFRVPEIDTSNIKKSGSKFGCSTQSKEEKRSDFY